MQNNNVISIILLVFVGVLSGLGLLAGINNAVNGANQSVLIKLDEISTSQKAIDSKLTSLIQRQTALDAKLNAAAPRPNPGDAQQRPMEDLNKVYSIPVGSSILVGKKDAPVTIQEFTDLQCPFCARFHPAIKATLKAYPDKVNLLIKHYPLGFHPKAKPAAKLALAANEQGKYIEMVEILLENGAETTEEKAKGYAQTLGLNYDKLMADLKNNDAKYEKQITDDIELGGQVDVRGTPTYFINGKKTMARDEAAFKAEVDKILAGAK